jgi:hypothetical protein
MNLPLAPFAAIVPPCSRPSRTIPLGRAKCTSLPAAQHVGGQRLAAGTGGRSGGGPNQRMRTKKAKFHRAAASPRTLVREEKTAM